MKKKIIISTLSILLVLAILGTGTGVYMSQMKKYKKIATPTGFSQFTEVKKEKVENADFYVSTTGNDKNDGSKAAPFRTIAKAKEAVRALEKKDDVTVAIMAGEYNEANIVFDEQDSGKENATITYTAYGDGEVIVNGGKTLHSTAFEKVSGAAAARLDESVVDKIMMLDLSKYNLTVDDYGKIKSIGGFSTEEYYDDAATTTECELFFNSERMSLAKYPNDGYLKEGAILDKSDCYEPNPPGPKDESWKERRNQRGGTFVMDDETYNRVKSWNTTEDVWVFGYFFWDWADMSTPIEKIDDEQKALTTKYCSQYGFKEGGIYYFYNVLEELDVPSEYYIDRENNILYFYPPEDLDSAQVMLSVTDQSIFEITENAKYINIDGITIQGTRGNAVTVRGENCNITNCNIKNAAGAGVDVSGKNNVVRACEISNMGKDGILLGGGAEEGFVYGNNIVDNCSIHDFGKLQKTYIAGVNLTGIGNKISHNEIYNAPHMGIYYTGNEHIMEYNHIHDVVLQSSDAGAIYTGYSFQTYGNIVRYNCINDIGSGEFAPSGIYFDDNSSGQTAYGNILINIPGHSILVGGGRDHVITDNISMNCNGALHYDDRAYDGYHHNGWYAMNCKSPDSRLWELLKEAKAFNETIGHKYEGIDRMHQDYNREEDEGFAVNPAGSVMHGNVVIGRLKNLGSISKSVYKYSDIHDNPTYALNSAEKFFTDMENGDYTFSKDSELIEQNPELQKIELQKIGRY